ncbi:DUF4974 domain-containing protein [Muricauda sp. TY007]|uniref:FecR family protein n=1 Tax=Allomuricauda sp. TY007 TaxID=2683200 RepID=UPI0013C12DF6|nr:FecR domain-containing protein [Muricauda sp. TY007]NDV16950.1 DUF4974 domain-containing protein [Muricauda sp. TY007]
MHKKETLKLLLKKLSASTQWKGKPEKDQEEWIGELYNSLVEEDLVDESLSFLDDLDVEGDWGKVKERLAEPKTMKLGARRKIFKYAAIFLGLISLGLGFVWIYDSGVPKTIPHQKGNFVILNTGDGTKFIDNHESHSIKLSTGETVAVHYGDTLIYEANEGISDSIFNELQIPNGKMFTLVLSDGTKIQLNSGTKIKFPARFPKTGNREVYVYGEAYFDVTKDSEHPFIVNSEEVSVKVLGTEFNFSSYKEQNEVTTVLIEGSVSLNHVAQNKEEVLLKPGEKGTWDRFKGRMEVKEVETSLYTGWMKGEVVFRNASFPELLANLERVYNVKIENTNSEIEKQTFNARFNRNVERIEDVLEALKIIVPFTYEEERGDDNRKIIIK